VTSTTPATPPTAWYLTPVMWLVVGLLSLSFLGGIAMLALSRFAPDPEVRSERVDAPPPVDAP
jgi:hypothetical protein